MLGSISRLCICMRKIDALETLTPEMGKNVYLNLAKHYIKAKTDNQTPNTPNVNLFWALRTALDNALADGGVEARVARYKECAGSSERE